MKFTPVEDDIIIEDIINEFVNFTIDRPASPASLTIPKILSSSLVNSELYYTFDNGTTTLLTQETEPEFLDRVMDFLEKEDRIPVHLIYTRVSAISKHAEIPESIKFQRDICLDYLKGKSIDPHGLQEIILWVSEGKKSAYRGRLPVLEMVLPTLKSGDTVYVYEVNRLSRNLDFGLELVKLFLEKKINCTSINDSTTLTDKPADIKRFNHALVEAHYESNRLSHRAKMAAGKRKEAGHKIGKVPYGFRRVLRGNLRVDEKDDGETGVIDRIMKYHKRRYTPKLIAERLNRTGVTYRGKVWNSTNISYLCRKHNK